MTREELVASFAYIRRLEWIQQWIMGRFGKRAQDWLVALFNELYVVVMLVMCAVKIAVNPYQLPCVFVRLIYSTVQGKRGQLPV